MKFFLTLKNSQMKKELIPNLVILEDLEIVLPNLVNTIDGRFLFNKVKVYNKNTQTNKIITLKDLLELDSAKFIEVKGISPKAKSILEQLQAKYSSIDTIILDSYTHSFLSMGLFSDQVTIPSDICDIALDNIKDLFSSRLFNAFKAIGLKAVKDVFRNNIENDIKIKNLGKSTLSEFLVFWDKTLNEEFENVRKASEKKQNDISFLPQDFLDIELDFIEDEIDRKIFNKLKPNNIILVRDFIQTNITTFSTMPYIGGS
jgi:hypothetical protein